MESDLDLARGELALARRRYESLLRAPYEGRWCGDAAQYDDRCANQRRRVEVLERDVSDLEAQES